MAEPQDSGMFQAARILLLVGAILQTLAACFVLLYALVAGVLFRSLTGSTAKGAALARIVPGLLLVVGVLVAAGAVMAWLAHSRAVKRDARGAFVRGLVGALLPPVQVVTLVGAILSRVSPEGERAPQAQGEWRPAPGTPPGSP